MDTKSPVPSFRDYATIWTYHLVNRTRFALLRRWLKARVEFGKDTDIWASCLKFQGSGNARFGECAIVERGPHVLLLDLQAGGGIDIGQRVFFRTKYCSSVITAFENARIEIGDDSMINGCIISARESVSIGRHCILSWHVTILDSNLHETSNSEPENIAPVFIGDHTWLGHRVTVLPGVRIGRHCVIGAGSVVTKDLPDNVIAAGVPARVIREVDDRDKAR